MERLKNIHIEKYGFTIQELPILALLKPAYLASASDEWNAVISPISDRMLAAHTGPIPGMDFRMIKAFGFMPLIHFSIA